LLVVFYFSNNSLFLYEMFDFYQTIYQNSLNVSFLVYIVSPIFWAYFVRSKIDSEEVSFEERFCFYYSFLLIISSVLLFPAITYRIVFFSFPIYVYLVCRCNSTKLSGLMACFGMIIHSAVMMLMSLN
jgi:hypothetical protein